MSNGAREQRQSVQEPISIEVSSGPTAARDALAKIMDAVKKWPLGDDCVGSVELVLAEAINNIVEHAYPPTDPNGPIRICGQICEADLHFRIEDEGQGMPDGALPAGKLQNLDVDFMDLPEGGFGWFIIKTLATDIAYERFGRENHLSIRMQKS